jgi:hypothetical protein
MFKILRRFLCSTKCRDKSITNQGGPCRSSSGQMLASHCGVPGSLPGSMWGLWWTKRHWGRFSPSTSVSPANHSTNFSPIIINRGWRNRSLLAAVPSGPNWTLPPTIRIRTGLVSSWTRKQTS